MTDRAKNRSRARARQPRGRRAPVRRASARAHFAARFLGLVEPTELEPGAPARRRIVSFRRDIVGDQPLEMVPELEVEGSSAEGGRRWIMTRDPFGGLDNQLDGFGKPLPVAELARPLRPAPCA